MSPSILDVGWSFENIPAAFMSATLRVEGEVAVAAVTTANRVETTTTRAAVRE